MTMRRIMIFGATSALGEAVARQFAAEGSSFFLVARNSGKLEAVIDDLRVRGASQVEGSVADARDFDRHQAVVNDAFEALNGLDTALVAHGTLPDQSNCEKSFEAARREFEINALAVMSLVTHLANRFEQQGFGTIAVISSVAGDRGRQSNYIYGAAKGTVSIFMQGLRNRLHSRGIHILTIKPGFVDTPMTSAFPKGILWARPEQVARGICKAIDKKKDVVYLPWFWSPIMGVIRALPEGIFKRLRL
jgi:decaprenylphospho-beta-D-erythro-pentofuranosid-2-ulose 2-reductase